ncbi:MarR family winged helix-turn-helix transcriptional regulator [Gemella sanguinis]
MMLISEKNKVTMQELGEELCVTKPRVTALVTELVNNDFIKQTVDKKDKRKKFLTLAPKGVEYVEEHHRNYKEWIKKLWSKFDDKEKEAFNITLTKMSQVLKEEVEEKEEE